MRPEVRVVAGPALDPRDLELVGRWVELNRDVLLAYWNGDLLTDEVIARLSSARMSRPIKGLRIQHADQG